MNSPIKKIDLGAIKDDKSSSLHKSLKTRIAVDGLVANVIVIDLDQVYLSDEAEAALKCCYLSAPYLLDKFGGHYKKNLMATVTRGNLKGEKYINTEANEYVHSTDTGVDILVVGKCVELDNRIARQIHITCRPQKPAQAIGSENTSAEAGL
ncbi:hypothetical protein [Rhodoferax sp. WC2427]|uniref:hypothetical protein n=1 Tax=Rhodoferax sp. WC2427 TaxID=3234144 RepID=UPI003465D296